MTIKKLYILAFLLSISSFVFSNDEKSSFPPEVQEKIDEMNQYPPITGTWVGKYFAKSMPKAKLDKSEDFGTEEFLKNGIEVKISISNSDVKLYLKYKPNDAWKEISGDIKINVDSLGFQIIVYRDSNVWIERYWFSVARTSGYSGKLVTTRSVHNWYGMESADSEFFSIYSEGNIKKLKDSIEKE
ncbi:MAG: hypothetical protein AB8B80_17145 [Marinicellaceae bacterium]